MSDQNGPPQDVALPLALGPALEDLRVRLEPCGDVIFRRFQLAGDRSSEAAAIYCRPLVDLKALTDDVLQSLMVRANLPSGEVIPVPTLSKAIDRALSGYVVILVDGAGAFAVELRAPVGRAVTEPTTENVIRGPREAFVESLEANLCLLRRRLPVPEFRVEFMKIGQRTRTLVSLIHLDGVTNPTVVAEARNRLQRIQIDGILDTAYLEELIEDEPTSPFPTIEHTERPDKVVASLLEGRIAILADNSPQALLAPVSLAQFLQAADDYYERPYISFGLRLLRYVSFVLALSLPSLFVAITTFHHEMIPSALFMALAAQREGIPWPAVLEAFLMEFAFELLREAGVRLPSPIGQSVSIVGGLVIGEAAIRANIASPATVIVVALTGIASFSIPAFSLAITLRLVRFPMMIMAAVLGLHGVVVSALIILIHMLGLRSFGVAYLAPVAPAHRGDWKDVLARAPRRNMRSRPEILNPRDRLRADPVRPSGGPGP